MTTISDREVIRAEFSLIWRLFSGITFAFAVWGLVFTLAQPLTLWQLVSLLAFVGILLGSLSPLFFRVLISDGLITVRTSLGQHFSWKMSEITEIVFVGNEKITFRFDSLTLRHSSGKLREKFLVLFDASGLIVSVPRQTTSLAALEDFLLATVTDQVRITRLR